MGVVRRIVATAAVGVFVSLFLAVTGSPGQAAWHCGSTCNDTNPDTFWVTPYQTCAKDAYTAKEVYIPAHEMFLQLRYSPYCRTVWARIYGGLEQPYWIGLQLVYPNGAGWTTLADVTEEIPPGPRTRSWSNQWDDAGVTIRACVSEGWSMEPPFRITCTQEF
jgi:hypothetical protein